MSEPKPPVLRRVKLRNYKSIRQCDVSLGRLTFLVGPNGSGKSNFLEALRFVSDSLRTTMQHAVEDRGEVRKILWRGREEDSKEFSIQLRLELPHGQRARYSITVTTDSQWLFVIEEESCVVSSGAAVRAQFRVQKGQVSDETTIPTPPPADPDQLYLTKVSGYQDFSTVYKLLKGMRFYNIDPQQIREEALSGQPARELQRNGKGALFAAHRLFQESRHHGSQVWPRMEEYLRAILPMVAEVCVDTTTPLTRSTDRGAFGHGKDLYTGEPRAIVFRLGTETTSQPSVRASGKHLLFDLRNISDGTLRAFGVLLALFECLDRPENDPIALVGIEEPESTLHPAAVGVLFDALHEASHFTQVLVTTHSAELLNIKDLDPDTLRVVDIAGGETIIGPADDASLSVMKDRMYTAGELLEMNQLRANPKPPLEAAAGSGSSPSVLPPDNE